MEIQSDASKSRWGAVLPRADRRTVISDYWLDNSPHISILEACTIKQALASFASCPQNTRVDVWADSLVIVQSWDRQGSRNAALNEVFKRIILCARNHNFDLAFSHLPSSSNVADCTVEVAIGFGSHNFDL